VSARSSIDPGRWPWTTGGRSAEAATRPPAASETVQEVELRRLRAELAIVRGRLASFEASLGPLGRSDADLHSFVERIPARVLNSADASVGPGGLIVSSGAAAGVEPGRPAVSATVLAAGEAAGVSSDAAVLAGAAVVGRTDQVGEWTSTVVPVTASEFRAHVRLVRESADGPVLGEDGLLEGDGRGGCVVKYVPSTAAVTAGDHVYSHDPSGRIPQPLYFGRIESASLRDGAPHWEIRVRPAADLSSIAEVHVLRPKPLEVVQASGN
jgi:cell shape-determining protein MreC